MVPDDQLKLEMRLTAIEYLLCDLWVKYYLQIGATYDQIMAAHKKTLEQLNKQTFAGLDPAQSDLAAYELEEAVRKLLDEQKQMMEPIKALLGRR
jgi:hypothetical protein